MGGVDPANGAAVETFYAKFGELPEHVQDEVLDALLAGDDGREVAPTKREYAGAIPAPKLSGDQDLETMADLGAFGDQEAHAAESLVGSGGTLVVQSNVRELIKKHKMNVSGKAVEALSRAVESLVKKACTHAMQDHRDRVEAEDIPSPTDLD